MRLGKTNCFLVVLFASLVLLVGAAPAPAAFQYLAQWGSGERQMSNPNVAVDLSGNVYVADRGNNRIQKFSSSGAFLTDWGANGAGDGEFLTPLGVATDSGGNVYVADTGNERIQKFTSSGAFITKWGSSGSADGQFRGPSGVATDSSGNVYVADTGNSRVQKFTSSGAFITKWGSFGSADGQFQIPAGVATDPTGVYVAEGQGNRIQKFNLSGAFLTKWGTSGSGDGQFSNPRGIATNGVGRVYVGDGGNQRIQVFTASGTFITKWGSLGAGNGQFGQTFGAMGVAVDSAGDVYVGDAGNHRIQRFDSSGGFLTKWGVSGSGNGQFEQPIGLDEDRAGNFYVYIADTENHQIQKLDGNGVFITKWGRLGSGGGQFSRPSDVATDSAGNVYVADTQNHRVQKFNSSGAFITSWGGLGSGNGQFDRPGAIAVDPSSGDVYVADSFNHRIQRFSSSGAFIAAFGIPGSGSGQFSSPQGIAIDASGIYVADTGNHRIQKFDHLGLFLAAWGSLGTGDGQFDSPQAVATDPTGDVWVADTGNDRIQKFSSTGGFLSKFGTTGAGNGEFDAPKGIASDSRANVLVADTNNHRIQKLGDPGQIVVVKNAIPNDPQDFTFTPGGGLVPTSFILDDDSDPTRLNARTLSIVPAGSGYSIAETVPGGWDQASATCDDGSLVSNIDVSAGETVTCTFTNRKRATIVARVDAQPNDPQDFSFTAAGGLTPPSFKLDDDFDPTLSSSRTFSNLQPGFGYSLSSTVPPEWTQRSATCDDGSPVSNIDVTTGETVTCTFVNQYSYPRPNGAAKVRVTLVPAHRQCTAPDGDHGPPYPDSSNDSCTSTGLVTDNLTVPNDDSTLHNASVTFRFRCSNGGQPPSCGLAGDQAEAQIIATVNDVRCASTASGSTPCGSANTTPGTDYTGRLLLELPLRITDHYNGSSFGFFPATVVDADFTLGITCTPSAADLSSGSSCSINTSTDTLVPGFAQEDRRALLALGQVSILDMGDNGTLATGTIAGSTGTCPPACKGDGDEQAFLRQGIFVP